MAFLFRQRTDPAAKSTPAPKSRAARDTPIHAVSFVSSGPSYNNSDSRYPTAAVPVFGGAKRFGEELAAGNNPTLP